MSQPYPQDPGLFMHQSNLIIGVTCFFLVLCIGAVIGRLCARRMARVKLEADDWMAIFALVCIWLYRRLGVTFF